MPAECHTHLFLLIASAVGRCARRHALSSSAPLFDLTPAQARHGGLLAGGAALVDTTREMNITYETARSHLSAVFLKTGTKPQADLVALLRDVRPLRRVPESAGWDEEFLISLVS